MSQTIFSLKEKNSSNPENDWIKATREVIEVLIYFSKLRDAKKIIQTLFQQFFLSYISKSTHCRALCVIISEFEALSCWVFLGICSKTDLNQSWRKVPEMHILIIQLVRGSIISWLNNFIIWISSFPSSSYYYFVSSIGS